MSDPTIPFWYTKLGADESDAIARSIAAGKLSQGSVTEEFEQQLGALLGVSSVVATTSGSAALYLAAAALGVGPGDEVILPDRTFIATAHAMLLTGARVRLIDVEADRTVMDVSRLEAAITPRTKAIVPVHLNGNSADLRMIHEIAARHGLLVIEDAAQAFASASTEGYLGTGSDAGCFSLGVTKLITTGQGGFVATRNDALAERMRRFRSHGVFDTFDATYERFGFNFKFTDIAASAGMAQLRKVPAKIEAHRRVYDFYRAAVANLDFIRICPADDHPGCVPLWTEALVADRERVIAFLGERGIQVRPYLPSLHIAPHLGVFDASDFARSSTFARHGIFLPSGPDMPDAWLERIACALTELGPRITGEPPHRSRQPTPLRTSARRLARSNSSARIVSR